MLTRRRFMGVGAAVAAAGMFPLAWVSRLFTREPSREPSRVWINVNGDGELPPIWRGPFRVDPDEIEDANCQNEAFRQGGR